MNFVKKIDLFYIVTFLFILISANASFLSANDIWWGLDIILMLVIALEQRLFTRKELNYFATFAAIYLIFMAGRDLIVNALGLEYLLSDVLFLFKLILMSYLFCVILKDKAAAYIVKIITQLTVLSFFFYFFQLVGLGDYIYTFSNSLHLPSANSIPGYTNFVFFTFVKGFHDYRNSGFAWEPGAFGGFLIIAMLLNFFLNRFTFDKKAVILLIGIITTASTTDYLALIFVLFLAYRYRIQRLNFWSILLIGLFISLVVFIPFLGDKIKDHYYEDLQDLNRLKFLDIYYKHNKMQIPLDRFSSMVIIYKTFFLQLILGISNKYDIVLNRLSKANINISNGVFDFMAKFGLIGLYYLLQRYVKFCYAFVRRIEYVFYCIIIFMVLGFGEPLLVLPIVLMFIFINRRQRNFKKRIKGMPEIFEDEGEESEQPTSRKYSALRAELAKFKKAE